MARFKSNRQLQSDRFFDRQYDKEQAAWKESLPKILESITAIIKYHPNRAQRDWQHSLSIFRECYSNAKRKVEDYQTSEAYIKQLCLELSKYSTLKLLLCKKEELGAATAYWLSFKKGNKWIKINDGIKLL